MGIKGSSQYWIQPFPGDGMYTERKDILLNYKKHLRRDRNVLTAIILMSGKNAFIFGEKRGLPYYIGLDRLVLGNTFVGELTGYLDKLRTLQKTLRSLRDKKTHLIQEQVKGEGETVRLER